jgi:hypothetical protein
LVEQKIYGINKRGYGVRGSLCKRGDRSEKGTLEPDVRSVFLPCEMGLKMYNLSSLYRILPIY